MAKVHKIAEHTEHNDRVRDKDALDVLRLLRATDTGDLATRLGTLRADELAGPVTEEALEMLPRLFGDVRSDGVLMAVRAAGTSEDPATIAGSLVTLVDDSQTKLGPTR